MDHILKRIQKLLALAKSSNPHEAAAAAAEAQRLMLKHGVESAESAPETVETLDVDGGSMVLWHRVLAGCVAKACFCKAFATRGSSRTTIYGFSANVAVAATLLAWLTQEINRLCEAEWLPLRSSGQSANAWKKSFRLGAVTTIGQRLGKEREMAHTDFVDEAFPRPSVALARLERYENTAALAIRSFLAAKGVRTSTSSVGFRNRDGYVSGVQAGQRIGLKPPVRALPGKS